MKQAELADAAGVSVFTISSVENGKATSLQLPPILLLTTFSNHLEILNRCKTQDQHIFYIL
ncbi:MAG: hypothetical protein J6I31_06330 [Prevotella sp.]|nr:hypothetical protein [Prevotella sp.]